MKHDTDILNTSTRTSLTQVLSTSNQTFADEHVFELSASRSHLIGAKAAIWSKSNRLVPQYAGFTCRNGFPTCIYDTHLRRIYHLGSTPNSKSRQGQHHNQRAPSTTSQNNNIRIGHLWRLESCIVTMNYDYALRVHKLRNDTLYCFAGRVFHVRPWTPHICILLLARSIFPSPNPASLCERSDIFPGSCLMISVAAQTPPRLSTLIVRLPCPSSLPHPTLQTLLMI